MLCMPKMIINKAPVWSFTLSPACAFRCRQPVNVNLIFTHPALSYFIPATGNFKGMHILR